MNGDTNIMVEILNAIEYGNLSLPETRRRLEELVDKEVQKTTVPANLPLIEECEKLLWELNTNGKVPYISHLQENKSAVVRHARKQHNLLVFKKYAVRISTVAAALFVVSIGFELLLNREWLGSTTSPDGEQLVISGEVYDPGMIEKGSAAETVQNSQRITTTNLNEATAFLGIDFYFPDQTLIKNWNLSYYECTKSRHKAKLLAYYTFPSDPQKTLIINAIYFPDIQDASLEFEQNKAGSTIEFHGIQLYLAENETNKQYMWMQGSYVYSIAGHVSLDEAKDIIIQMIGG